MRATTVTTNTTNERGIAMVTTLLVMMLVSALLVGFTAVIMSDQRFRFIDRDRTQAFYAAAAGIEKLTADLGNLFYKNVSPTSTQIQGLTANQPSITGVSYTKSDGTSGYTITPVNLGSQTVTQGPYAGLNALVTNYIMDVTARTTASGEVHLHRETETVAIPVFQFGVFSDLDLSFHAGPNFNFGGRVHTNGNLFLCQGGGATLTMQDKVTAYKEVVRQQLQNGLPIASWNCTGTVKIATASGACNPNTNAACRALGYNTPTASGEGSVVGGPTGTPNGNWQTISQSYYNSYLMNGKLGAKKLDLPLITLGGANVDLVRRAAPAEDTSNPTLFGERYYSKASLRILLSDTSADITGLPTITATAPISLEPASWPPAGYTGGRPIATSPGLASTTTAAGSTTTTLNVSTTTNIPAYFKIPANITVVGTSTTANNVICTARTPTQLQHCNNVPAYAIGATVSANVPAGSGTVLVTAVTTNNSAGGSNITIQMANTAAFAPTTFWLNNTLVTCTGYDVSVSPQTFTGCTGISTAPGSGQSISTYSRSNAGVGLIGGVIKIEMQTAAGTWQDVTLEILNYGIAGPSLTGSACGLPTPNAILRLERLRDSGNNACTAGSFNSNDYWPNVLFDTREGLFRDTDPGNTNVTLGGTMYYVTLDVGNLSKWFKAIAPYDTGSGASALSANGYTVYFSDRRNNRNGSSQETAEYGFEDFVNADQANGAPNNHTDTGEDVNGNNVFDTYGQFPSYGGTANTAVPGATAPLDLTARPSTAVASPLVKVNRPILFRRALKLTNGGLGNIVSPGLTVATENPVYIQGNWNMNAYPPPNNDGHVATSVIADAVTLLSGNWNDLNSFSSPYVNTGRPRAVSYYRVAIISGKGMAFPNPMGTTADFGNDGGVHNFLRYLEDANGPVNYRGSIASFYYNRQAVGTFKCSAACGTVFGAPVRNYDFDIDFLDATKLPPLTPVFRDLNTVAFSVENRPGK